MEIKWDQVYKVTDDACVKLPTMLNVLLILLLKTNWRGEKVKKKVGNERGVGEELYGMIQC